MKIVVTRPEGQEQELVARLERLGHEVVHCPLIAIEPLGDEPIDVAGYDWVVVTSANGARELLRRARGTMPRVAAIGPATADGARAAPTSSRRVSTQEGLLAELPRPAGRVLFAAAEGARRLLPDALGADVVALYRTRELRPARAPGRRPLRARLRLGGARPRRARGPGFRSSRSARRRRVRRARPGSTSSPRPSTHRRDGLVAAVAGLSGGRPLAEPARRLDSSRCSSRSSPTSGSRTTSSAPATA